MQRLVKISVWKELRTDIPYTVGLNMGSKWKVIIFLVVSTPSQHHPQKYGRQHTTHTQTGP